MSAPHSAPVSELADFLLARIAEDEVSLPNPSSWVGYVGGLTDEERRADEADEAAWERRWAYECEAKRRIVNDFSGTSRWSTQLLRLLALPYADHPDYREEWRP